MVDPENALTGIRGSNDLVWVGQAANNVAKLTELPSDCPSWITADVFNMLAENCKYSDGDSIWEHRSWTAMDDHSIYCSRYWWEI